jgi:hypothetical protein
MAGKERTPFEKPGVEDDRRMRAVVLNRVDPLMEGRVLVNIPRITPDGDPAAHKEIKRENTVNKDFLQNEELGDHIKSTVDSSNGIWARPLPECDFLVPYVGETIYVIMEDGDPSKVYYTKERPSLNGQTTAMSQVRVVADIITPDKRPNINILHEFKDGTTIYYNENEPSKEFHIKFPTGFEFSIQDNPENKNATISTQKGFKLVLDDLADSVRMETPKGMLARLDDKTNEVMINNQGSASKINMKDNNIEVSNKDGSKYTAKGGVITVENSSGAKQTFNGAVVTTEAGGGKITVGNGKVMIN